MAASVSLLPLVAQAAVERLDKRRQAFVLAFYEHLDVRAACAEARVTRAEGEKWRDEPEILTAIKMIRDVSSQAHGVSTAWLIRKQREVFEKANGELECTTMTKQGVYKGKLFDGFNANKALENLAKMTGNMGSGAIPTNLPGMSADRRAEALKNLLTQLEARANASGTVIEGQAKELPSPPQEEPLFD